MARTRSPAISAFPPLFEVERTFVRQAEIDALDPLANIGCAFVTAGCDPNEYSRPPVNEVCAVKTPVIPSSQSTS
jgi:hypothetical protein